MDENKGGVRYFYKHSTINTNVAITLKGLSDANDSLGISMCAVPPEYKEEISKLQKAYTHLAIQRNPINIPRVYLDAAISKLAISSKNLDKKSNIYNSPSKNPIVDVDISYFRKTHMSECSLFMVVQLSNNGKTVEPAITTSRLKAFNFFEHIVFPITYADLAPDATIAITVYDMNKSPEKGLIGGTCINLFNYHKCLRQGNYSLYIHKKAKGDPSLHTTTVGLLDDSLVQEKNKLYAYIDRHSSREIKAIPWLDSLAYQTIGKKLEKIDHDANFGALDICLPVFDFPVIWKEQKYPRRDVFIGFSKFEERRNAMLDKSSIDKQSIADHVTGVPITLIYDPSVMCRKKEDILNPPNPIADKYYILSRVVDEVNVKELQPTPEEKEEIEEIFGKPDFQKVDGRAVSLVWRYRYFYQDRKDALIKMLMSADWDNEKEEKEAISLLKNWAPIELEQAVIMLSFIFSLNPLYQTKTHPSAKSTAIIRHHAIEYLCRMKDDELDSILIQLVQAFRYEDMQNSELKKFLIMRAIKSQLLSCNLMWYLLVEVENKTNGEMKKYYEQFYTEFNLEIEKLPDKSLKKILDSQLILRIKLLKLSKIIKSSKTKSEEKTKQLRELIGRLGAEDMTKFEPVPVPVNPRIIVNGVISEKSSVFRSATYPMKIVFNVDPTKSLIQKTDENTEFPVLYKEGDDLRQDQLILQMIEFMDKLLKSVTVDLKFSVYRVVAAGIKDGFAEFVSESTTISAIKKEFEKSDNPIADYLKKMEKEKKIPYPSLLEAYVNSCAGYSAITYLLGIGDRHLENLMMRKNGRFFHIDFGFILGNDPKPFPPPIRISGEMVKAMKDKDYPSYDLFCKKCVDAFNHLRKFSKLFVNLFFLMVHAGLKDLVYEDGFPALTKLYERFMPDKNDTDAEQAFLELINESVSALSPKVMEAIHVWASYFK